MIFEFIENLNKKFLNRGFSLVETLVAIFILAMSITAAMTVAQSSLQASFYARDRVQAFFLAQEAMELVKNKRDINGLKSAASPVDWLDGFSACQTGECGIDAVNFLIRNCGDVNDCELCENGEGFLVNEDSGSCTATGIKRKIHIEDVGPNEVEVTVAVTWANDARELEVVEHIYNWHPFSQLN